MKEKLVIFIPWLIVMVITLAMVAGFPDQVDAKRQATSTPTWDIRTPPNTPAGTPDVGAMFPTVTATLDSSCPLGTPIGYGTLTPSVGWQLSCGHCLPTQTALNTPDFGAIVMTNQATGGTLLPTYTATATKTATPTATGTPTATPTAPFTFHANTETFNGYNSHTADANTMTCSAGVGVTGQTLLTCSGHISFTNVNQGGIEPSISAQADVGGSGSYTWYYDMVYSNIVGGSITRETIDGTIVSTTPPSSVNGSFSHAKNTATGGNGWLLFTSPNTSHTVSGDFVIRLSAYPITGGTPTPTPLPSVTPTPGNYCSAISTGTYDYKSWYTLIGLTGSKQCFASPYISAADFFGSGWIAFFSFIFPTPIADFIANAVVPAQTWCFYGVGFTVISLFGIQIDPSVFADIAIFLFVLAHFLNK